MFSRAPSAKAQRNNVSFSFLHLILTLVCLKDCKHPCFSEGRTSRRIATPCRYGPSLRLVQTTTCPNSAERCPIFNLLSTVAHLTELEPCGRARRPTYNPSCRCIALHKLHTTCARRARDAAVAEPIVSRQWCRGAFAFWLDGTSLVRVVQGSPKTTSLSHPQKIRAQ